MRALARLVALGGALAVGYFLLSASPRDVVLVYDVGRAEGALLEVELRRGGEVLRRADLSARGGGQVRHPVRLPEGDYVLAWRLTGPAGARSGERPIEIREDGTIVLPLGR